MDKTILASSLSSVAKLWEDQAGAWDWIDASGSILDAYDAFSEIFQSLPRPEIRLYGAFSAIKTVTPETLTFPHAGKW